MEKTLYSKVLFPLAYFIRFPNFGAVATKLLDEQCPECSIIYFVIFLLFRKIFIWLYHVKYEVSDTIYGEGPVIFDYLPLSDNTNKDRLSGETLVNESNDGAYYWGVSLFNPDPNKYTARFSRVSLNFDILKTTSSYVDVATKDNLNSHGINGYAHGSFVRCVRSN